MLAFRRPTLSAGGRQAVKGKTVDPFFFQVQKGALNEGMVIGGNVMDGRIIFRQMIGASDTDDGHMDIN